MMLSALFLDNLLPLLIIIVCKVNVYKSRNELSISNGIRDLAGFGPAGQFRVE